MSIQHVLGFFAECGLNESVNIAVLLKAPYLGSFAVADGFPLTPFFPLLHSRSLGKFNIFNIYIQHQ